MKRRRMKMKKAKVEIYKRKEKNAK